LYKLQKYLYSLREHFYTLRKYFYGLREHYYGLQKYFYSLRKHLYSLRERLCSLQKRSRSCEIHHLRPRCPFPRREGDSPIFAAVKSIRLATFLTPRKLGQSPVNARGQMLATRVAGSLQRPYSPPRTARTLPPNKLLFQRVTTPTMISRSIRWKDTRITDRFLLVFRSARRRGPAV